MKSLNWYTSPKSLNLYCPILLTLLLFNWTFLSPGIAGQLPPQSFYELHKGQIQSIMPSEYTRLRELTNRLDGGFALVQTLADKRLLEIANLVGRLDVLYEENGNPVSSDVCTATWIGHHIVTAKHCVPGLGPGIAAKLKFTRNYASDLLTIDDRIDIEITSSNVTKDPRDVSSIYTSTTAPSPKRYQYREPIEGETIILISHPLGQGKRISIGGCRVQSATSKNADTFTHTCATLPGSSGAMLFAKTDLAILGIHSRGGEFSGTAVKIGKVIDQMPKLAAEVDMADPPAVVESNGSVLTKDDLIDQVAQSMAGSNYRETIDMFLKGGTSQTNELGGLSLYRLATKALSIQALKYLGEQGVSLEKMERKLIIWDAIDALARGGSDDPQVLHELIKLGAQLSPNPSSGIAVECFANSVAVVRFVQEIGKSC